MDDFLWKFKIYRAWKDYLLCWNWEWFVSLTFSNDYRRSPLFCKRMLNCWKRQLCEKEHLQVGMVSILSYKGYLPHFHLFMLGKSKRGKTLSDISTEWWEIRWSYQAKIKQIYSLKEISYYFCKHLLSSIDGEPEINIQNEKLLKKTKQKLFNTKSIDSM